MTKLQIPLLQSSCVVSRWYKDANALQVDRTQNSSSTFPYKIGHVLRKGDKYVRLSAFEPEEQKEREKKEVIIRCV